MKVNGVIPATRKRLLKQRGSYRLIAQHGRLTYSWVSKFACGEIGKRPSYNLLKRLMLALDAFELRPAKIAPGKARGNPCRKVSGANTRARKRA